MLKQKKIGRKKGTFCCEKVRLKETIRWGKKSGFGYAMSFEVLIPYAALLELLC